MNLNTDNIYSLQHSREMMERKPKKFVYLFIYILLTAISIFIIWACVFTKETVVTVSGSVLPENNSLIITNKISAILKSSYVTDGQSVRAGDILYTLDDSELQIQKSQLELQKSASDKKLQNLEKLETCVKDNSNYFSDSEEEKEYYYKFEAYLASDNSTNLNKLSLIRSKANLSTNINKLETLIRSINNNVNYNEPDSLYDIQFKEFQVSKAALENKINQLEKNISNSTSEEQTQSLTSQIESLQNELSILTLSTKEQIQKSIDDLKTENANIDINSLDESDVITKEKNKIALLADIAAQKTILNQELEQINFNIDQYNKNIESCTVKSESNGKLDLKTPLNNGSLLQAGVAVANILPEDETYKVQLVIPESSIANIKENQEIKYSFTSLPYNEYGFLTGSVETLGVSSKVNSETGMSFYIATASLNSSSAYGHNNEEAKIKSGMTCQARIITKKTKIIYYFLDKLKLITY